MTDEDIPRSAELESLLGRARKASPPRARLDAVRARLEAELGPLGPPPEPPAQSAPPARQSPSWLAPAGAVVVLACVLAAIVARQPAPATPRPVATSAPSEQPAIQTRESPTFEGDSRDPSPAPSERAPSEPVVVVAPEAPPSEPRHEPQTPHDRAPRATERAAGEGGATREADPSAAPDEAARASQLREEIAILERAMGHRRAGDLEGARAAIAEHARRFPRGLLAPERDRLASELE